MGHRGSAQWEGRGLCTPRRHWDGPSPPPGEASPPPPPPAAKEAGNNGMHQCQLRRGCSWTTRPAAQGQGTRWAGRPGAGGTGSEPDCRQLPRPHLWLGARGSSPSCQHSGDGPELSDCRQGLRRAPPGEGLLADALARPSPKNKKKKDFFSFFFKFLPLK